MSELEPTPIAELVARWRTHPVTSYVDVVGHAPQIRRLRELAALLALDPAERARLRLRVGAGVVLSGAAGSGKTMLARAFAAELGRDVVAPPPGELDAERIDALYRALTDDPVPVAVLLDEAGSLVGDADWTGDVDRSAQRALAVALDGVSRPEVGPVTIALTTIALAHLDDEITRPGRLSPRLELGRLSGAERAELLRRAVTGLPGAETLRLARLVERTVGWSGAEITGLVPEALTRSLLEGAPTLHEEALLAIVSERFVVRDPLPEGRRDPRLAAIHEAGHCLFAYLTWGRGPEGQGPVAAVDLTERGGTTALADWVLERPGQSTRRDLLRSAGLSLAGAAAERIVRGVDGLSAGAEDDRQRATAALASVHALEVPFDEASLEGHSGHGAHEMRAARFAAISSAAQQLWEEVLTTLAPHAHALLHLADALVAAPDQALSGAELEAAVAAALGPALA